MPHPPAISENLEQRALFEEYVKMPGRRSLRRLFESGVTTRSWKTVQAWSIKFNWVKRVQQKEKELMDVVGLESPRESIERKQLVLKIIDLMIDDIVKRDENGLIVGTKFGAKNVFDIRTLVDIRDEVLGIKKAKESDKGGTTNIDKALFIIKK
jgi:hypothetical protein